MHNWQLRSCSGLSPCPHLMPIWQPLLPPPLHIVLTCPLQCQGCSCIFPRDGTPFGPETCGAWGCHLPRMCVIKLPNGRQDLCLRNRCCVAHDWDACRKRRVGGGGLGASVLLFCEGPIQPCRAREPRRDLDEGDAAWNIGAAWNIKWRNGSTAGTGLFEPIPNSASLSWPFPCFPDL